MAGKWTFATLARKFLEQNGIPKERFDGYLWRIDDKLGWYLPTNWGLTGFPESSSKV